MKFFCAAPLLLVIIASTRADPISGVLGYNLLGGQEPATNQTLVKRADGEAFTGWDNAVQKGTTLWKQLVNGQHFDKETRTLEEDDWTVRETRNSAIGVHLKLLLKEVAQFEGLPNLKVTAAHQGGARGGQEIQQGWLSEYTNIYCPEHKTMIAYVNEKATKAQYPPQLFWSDVVFVGWKKECEKRGLPFSSLQQIIRSNVVNKVTREIIAQAYSNLEPRTSMKDPVTWLPSGKTKEAFLALLGSPNGSGVARLLLEHEKALGRKTVVSVETRTITAPDEPKYAGLIPLTFLGIVWNIGDASPPATAGRQGIHGEGTLDRGKHSGNSHGQGTTGEATPGGGTHGEGTHPLQKPGGGRTTPGETPGGRKRKFSPGKDGEGSGPVHRAGK